MKKRVVVDAIVACAGPAEAAFRRASTEKGPQRLRASRRKAAPRRASRNATPQAGAWFLVFPFWLINKDSWETAQKRIAESSSDALKVAEG